MSFELVGSSPNCTYNMISIPLDKSATITNATSLVNDIGDIRQALAWDPENDIYGTYNVPDLGTNADFAVSIGYPC